jgi:DNA-binding response OmpR family regulator
MKPKRILLVDDEALVALAAEDALLEAGYNVIGPADRLESALHLAETEEIDAAVLDVNLAGVYVWPVVEALNARGVPFILLTGFGKALDLPPSCQRATVLAKPHKPQELLAALAAQMARVKPASRQAFPVHLSEGVLRS